MPRKIRESDIEREFCKQVMLRGGIALKFTSMIGGVPDRVVILRDQVFFVELKAPGGTLRPLQKAMIRRMRKAGAEVFVISSFDQIAEVLL